MQSAAAVACAVAVRTRSAVSRCWYVQPADLLRMRRTRREGGPGRSKDAADRVVQQAALRVALDESAACQLAGLISEISEDHFSAGWLHGLEFTLWNMLHGDDRRFGMGKVSQENIDRLRHLHEKCGGWWRWDETHGEMFVATADWIALVKVGAKS